MNVKDGPKLRFIQADKKNLDRLDLEEAAQKNSKSTPADLPLLVSERALEESEKVLAKQARESILQGYVPAVEFLPKPKQRYGNRPLAVLDPITRTFLTALNIDLKEALPASSRDDKFDDFENYGTDRTGVWVVEFDIASCYEYVDHDILSRELVLQGAEQQTINSLSNLFGAIFERDVGLPQGPRESDRLADAYLSIVERRLKRRGYEVARYADDFKIVVGSRREAFDAIEKCMEEARRVYLSLAEQKIDFKRSEDLLDDIKIVKGLFGEYTETAFGELIDYSLVPGIYDDTIDEVYPEPDEVNFEATLSILRDWSEAKGSQLSALARAGALGIRTVKGFDSRIDNDILSAIVAKEPLRVKLISEYILERSETVNNWELIADISQQERISPWHKIWLLNTASRLESKSCRGRSSFLDYAIEQVMDSHELVRLEAAWLLAVNESLDIDRLVTLYGGATNISTVGLAAVAGLVNNSNTSNQLDSIRSDSRLNRSAFKWGSDYGSNA
ncbi:MULTISPECIES: reverse transcriptase domain-containing protein [Brevibacterium]|uniref:Reverse transcriptase (RNA-dependent DNA polymerase) n=1 Tax=Brevibacterium aurantiacum TaxID=273384 RepID=A0A2H1JTN7_BREAU|nr:MULTISPECIES: reverse transcriptase domain-containing protein [Brevibacterium]SMX90803.1 Reverse transcriptase (RNA-dependent DNA polymerase) [Brevibacterium aurantiacum]